MISIFVPFAAASVLFVAEGNSAGPVQVSALQDRVPYESVTESERLYQEDAAETIRGVVESIDTVTLKEGATFKQVRLKIGNDAILVHLGPQWFMDRQINRMQIDVGRELEIQGSRNVVDGKPVLVAAELRNERREERLRLRHPSGVPVWVGGEYIP